jgi:hypothetical protein
MNEMTDRRRDIPPGAERVPDDVAVGPADLASLEGRIRSGLGRRGWLRVDAALSLSEFEGLGARLGAIELRTDIVVDPMREREQRVGRLHHPDRPGVYAATALELHTDRPTAAVLAWYCVEPDAAGGATHLVDTRPLLARFSAEEQDALGRVRVSYMRRDPVTGREDLHHAPLIDRRGGDPAVFYVPWLVEPPEDDAARALLERFRSLLDEESRRGCLGIRLERGECLFIDNRRMLHGRGAIPQDSRRHLVRLYIRAGTDAGAPDDPASGPGRPCP